VSGQLARIVFVVVAAAVSGGTFLGCATSNIVYDYASEPDPRRGEFVLGPSDILRVTVWRNADLSVDAVVRPDGTITLPLIGDMRAAGRTTSELRTEISQRLSAFIKEAASVTVAIAVVNSYRFTVSGNVERGGAFTASHYVTVTEALALAGGPNRFGSPEETVIMRLAKDGRPKRVPIDYNAILKGTRPEMNLVLLPGDVVYVP
jgi:polysaccharide export outer membrane protein